MIDIDQTPKVLFKEGPNSLLSQPQRATNPQGVIRLNPQSPRPAPFPIETLAVKPLPSYQAPTPPESPFDKDGQEPMDWTPSQPQLAAPTNRQNEPSPPVKQPPPRAGFRGHLPPDIVSPAHRLRNPPNQPSFRAASEATKAAFMTGQSGSNADRGNAGKLASEESPDEDDDDSSPTKSVFSVLSSPGAGAGAASSRRRGGGGGPDFRNPQFFPPGEQRQNETGLESLLQNAFSIGEPAEVTNSRQRRRGRGHNRPRNNNNTTTGTAHNDEDDQQYHSHRLSILFQGIIALISLLLSYILLYTTPPLVLTRLLASFPPTYIQFFALGIPASVAARALLTTLFPSPFASAFASTSTPLSTLAAAMVAFGQCIAVGVLIAAVRGDIDVASSSTWVMEMVGKVALVGIGVGEVGRRWILLRGEEEGE